MDSERNNPGQGGGPPEQKFAQERSNPNERVFLITTALLWNSPPHWDMYTPRGSPLLARYHRLLVKMCSSQGTDEHGTKFL